MFFKNKNKFTKLKKKIKSVFNYDDGSSFNMLEVTVVIVISILFGIIVGCILTYSKGYAEKVDDKYIKELVNTYDTLLENYYDSITEKDLMNAAIDGMVSSLDDAHSYYMDPTETIDFNQRVDGSYIGIGATISFSEDSNSIIEIFDDSPAANAGLKVGDKLISIDDKDVSNADISTLSNLLMGESGTKVKVKVLRVQKEKTFTLTRGIVIIPSVSSKVVVENDKKIGFIDIDNFAANTYHQFKEHLEKLEDNNIEGLIIDVRDNTGGHLTQVNKILSMFFNKKTVLYQVEKKNSVEKVYSSGKKLRNYEIVVLVNQGSASASEILASCFQDNYKKATIVGSNTFGKGTIQSAIQLSTGASLKYTSQKWLTSGGVWIEGVGIFPDEEVEIKDNFYSVAGENDLQYDKAIEILSKK